MSLKSLLSRLISNLVNPLRYCLTMVGSKYLLARLILFCHGSLAITSVEKFVQDLEDSLAKEGTLCIMIICSDIDYLNYCPITNRGNFKIPVLRHYKSASQKNGSKDSIGAQKLCRHYIVEGRFYRDIIKSLEASEHHGGKLVAIAYNETNQLISDFLTDKRVLNFSNIYASIQLRNQNRNGASEFGVFAFYQKQLCGTKMVGVWPYMELPKILNQVDRGDVSCILLKGTAFPYAPYTRLDDTKDGTNAYSGFEVSFQ